MSFKYPFINSCKGYMKEYIKIINAFINPYKRVYERVYASTTNGKKGFIIRCTFINSLRVYYSTLIFYSVDAKCLPLDEWSKTIDRSTQLLEVIVQASW